jgi:hypothetical protein
MVCLVDGGFVFVFGLEGHVFGFVFGGNLARDLGFVNSVEGGFEVFSRGQSHGYEGISPQQGFGACFCFPQDGHEVLVDPWDFLAFWQGSFELGFVGVLDDGAHGWSLGDVQLGEQFPGDPWFLGVVGDLFLLGPLEDLLEVVGQFGGFGWPA